MTKGKQTEKAIENFTDALIKMAIESWRLAKMFDRLITKLDAGEKSRYESRLRWFRKKTNEALAQVDMHIVNLEGQSFDPGVAATAINIGEFKDDDILIVDQMLEPIIMGKEGLVKTGTVILRKVKR